MERTIRCIEGRICSQGATKGARTLDHWLVRCSRGVGELGIGGEGGVVMFPPFCEALLPGLCLGGIAGLLTLLFSM